MPDRPPPLCFAKAEVKLSDPLSAMAGLCRRFTEFGTVAVNGRSCRIETVFGVACLEACRACLRVEAEAADETALAFVKLSIAEHLLQMAPSRPPSIVWHGDAATGRPLPYFREMRVTACETITPRMRRLTLEGADLVRFDTNAHHVRLLFPRDGDPVWPVMGADGRPRWPGGTARLDARAYTIRRIDAAAGTVEIDMVLHDGAAPGGDFARGAVPGAPVGMTGPGGGGTPDADWLLLGGDETALPAIARILEELPETATAVVCMEVANADETQALSTRAKADVLWHYRDRAANETESKLAAAIREVEIPDADRRFVWVGCEFDTFRTVRKWLRDEVKLERKEHLAVAYWRRGRKGDDAPRS